MSNVRSATHGSRSPDSLAVLAAIPMIGLCVLLGWLVNESAASGRAAIFAASVATVGVVVAVGRRDLTRPEVLLPAIWFTGVALAQLRLLAGYETPWSDTMIIVAFGAPAAFAAGSLLAGRAIARPLKPLGPTRLASQRLRFVAMVLFVVGVIGLTVKAQRTGGIALFSNEIDSLRSAGGIHVPAWMTMMTDCLFLGFWTILLAFPRHRSSAERAFDSTLGLLCIAGVSLSASRNTLMIAITVPLVFMYLSRDGSHTPSRRFIGLAAVGLIIGLVTSGLFFVRTGQHRASRFESNFYTYVVPQTPEVARPLLPVYISLSAPLETLNRTIRHSKAAAGNVRYSAPGIPPQISPFGVRGDFYRFSGAISRPYYFNVATYAGPIYLDGRLPLVLAMSLVFGLASGGVRRWALVTPTVLRLAILAYVTYLIAFLVYENILSVFTLSVVFDLMMISIVVRWCSVAPDTHDAAPLGESND